MLYLASNSPRRKELLTWLKIPFKVIPNDFSEEKVKENLNQESPEEIAANLAYYKAFSTLPKLKEGLLLTADTDVYLEGQVLGKPADYSSAKEMLLRLSGREHMVVTAVCLMEVETTIHKIEIEVSRVRFFSLTEKMIDSYLNKVGKKVFDKAGAYAIQLKESKDLIADYQGSLTNIIGLPLKKTTYLLEEFGVLVADEVLTEISRKIGQED